MSGRRLLVAIAAILVLLSISIPVPAAGEQGVLVPGVSTPWPGKILVGHDEWVVSDSGMQLAPTSRQFALNVATWFTGGRPGRFLVHSHSHGLTGARVAATMRGAGHEWTVDTSDELTLATLQRYDAVFLAGDQVDTSVLIDYVRLGGGVFLQGGTGVRGTAGEAAHWNTFLHAFGLHMSPTYNTARAGGVWPVSSTSPLFRGVTSLYEQLGSPVAKLNPADPYTRILMASDKGLGLYAAYETPAIAVGVKICPTQVTLPGRGQLSVAIPGSSRLDVRTIDPASVRLLGVAPRSSLLDYGLAGTVSGVLGALKPGSCGIGLPDQYVDLVFSVDAEQLVQAIQRALDHALRDNDAVAVTLTGRLKPGHGGQPIVGEDVIVVRAPR